MRLVPILAALALAAPAMVTPALVTPAQAGPASERVFSNAALNLVQADQYVQYSHVREGSAGESLNPIPDGQIRVAVRTGADKAREAVVTMGPAGKLKPVSVWPVSSGNPILPIFLESALRAMARTTGGSSFYIRNRIKESLGSGGTMTDVQVTVDGNQVAATEIVFVPFKADKNRDRMGDFKDLTLTFVVSEQTPGDIVRFVAQTPEGANGVAYREEIAFSRLATGE